MRVNDAKGILTLRQNGLLQLKLDLTNMLPRPCLPYFPATARLSVHVEAKLGTSSTCTQFVLSPSGTWPLSEIEGLRGYVPEVRSRSMVGGDQGEEK